MGPTYQLMPENDKDGTANSSIGKITSDAGLRGAEILLLAWRNIAKPESFNELENFIAEIEVHSPSSRSKFLCSRSSV